MANECEECRIYKRIARAAAEELATITRVLEDDPSVPLPEDQGTCVLLGFQRAMNWVREESSLYDMGFREGAAAAFDMLGERKDERMMLVIRKAI